MAGRTKINFKMSYPKEIFFKKKDNSCFWKVTISWKSPVSNLILRPWWLRRREFKRKRDCKNESYCKLFVVVQPLSCVPLFVTPRTAACKSEEGFELSAKSEWSRSVVSYRFLKRQVRWSGIPISFKIFHSLLWLYVYAAAKSLQSCPTLRPHGLQPTRLLRPWDFPGKSTGVGCHCLLRI